MAMGTDGQVDLSDILSTGSDHAGLLIGNAGAVQTRPVYLFVTVTFMVVAAVEVIVTDGADGLLIILAGVQLKL